MNKEIESNKKNVLKKELFFYNFNERILKIFSEINKKEKRKNEKDYYLENILREIASFGWKNAPKIFLGNESEQLRNCVIIKTIKDAGNISTFQKILIYKNFILIKEKNEMEFKKYARTDVLKFGRVNNLNEFKIILNSSEVSQDHFGIKFNNFFPKSKLCKKFLYLIKAKKQILNSKIVLKILKYLHPKKHRQNQQKIELVEYGSLFGTWILKKNEINLLPKMSLLYQKITIRIEMFLKKKNKTFYFSSPDKKEEYSLKDECNRDYMNIFLWIFKNYKVEIYINGIEQEHFGNIEKLEKLFDSDHDFKLLGFFRYENYSYVNYVILICSDKKEKEFFLNPFYILAIDDFFYWSPKNDFPVFQSLSYQANERYEKTEIVLQKKTILNIVDSIFFIDYYNV